MRRNRELALFDDDFEMRRHADVTLRLQQISTMLIGEGTNGALYEHVLDAAIDFMSADMGSMQVFRPERGELRLLAERGFHPESAAYWEWVRLDSGSTCGMALSAGCRVVVRDIEACEAMVGTGGPRRLPSVGHPSRSVHATYGAVGPPIGHDLNPLEKAPPPNANCSPWTCLLDKRRTSSNAMK
jgi:hypothetical protein